MERIENLTKDQIFKLKPEEITMLIDLACADAGIKLISKPVEPAYHEIAGPDLKHYYINWMNISFSNREDAEEILDKVSKCTSIVDNGYLSSVLVETQRMDEFRITVKDVYSRNLFDEIKDLLNLNAAISSEFKAKMEEYAVVESARRKIEDKIHSIIDAVKEEYQERDYLCNTFQSKYLPLDNNYENCMKFFKAAFSMDIETENYIRIKFDMMTIPTA